MSSNQNMMRWSDTCWSIWYILNYSFVIFKCDQTKTSRSLRFSKIKLNRILYPLISLSHRSWSNLWIILIKILRSDLDQMVRICLKCLWILTIINRKKCLILGSRDKLKSITRKMWVFNAEPVTARNICINHQELISQNLTKNQGPRKQSRWEITLEDLWSNRISIKIKTM